MSNNQAVLYTTPGCSACAAVKNYLRGRGVVFAEKDVTTDPAYLEEMKRLAGVRIAPVTVIGDQAFYGTFDQQRPQIDAALAAVTTHRNRA